MVRTVLTTLTSLALAGLAASAAQAGPDNFGPGPVIPDFGPIAMIENHLPIPEGQVFRISFDTATGADEDALNSTLTGAARFINMHAAAGVPVENIQLAIVVHGGAMRDVSTETAGTNAALVAALVEQGVQIIVCGQSAAWYDISNEDLLPGVDMALSAMTAHALLQADGYSLNPF
ncbi:DsrE family protein [Maricaulis parjimensis]|uniref:DsrE family protein n=1 Tax=Maricaulis parjimensis TaxID=144023 RepID=UPI00193A8AD8|nr:DsrE family protein [Maricaulis parjimensis]